MSELEKYAMKLVKEFGADTYRIKDKNGVVVKYVKKGIEVEIEKNDICKQRK